VKESDGRFVNILNNNPDPPLLNSNNLQVMCDCYTPAGEPIPTNKRNAAAKIFSNPAVAAEEPWYIICIVFD
jgi:glutamine synthetase